LSKTSFDHPSRLCRGLFRKELDLEKIALARAVRLHLDNRVLVYEHKTVIFDWRKAMRQRAKRAGIFLGSGILMWMKGKMGMARSNG
jgi:hypothetical protein